MITRLTFIHPSFCMESCVLQKINTYSSTMIENRVGLVEVLLGILDWRAGGRQGLCNQMKWNESEASIGRVLAVEVSTVLSHFSQLSWDFRISLVQSKQS